MSDLFSSYVIYFVMWKTVTNEHIYIYVKCTHIYAYIFIYFTYINVYMSLLVFVNSDFVTLLLTLSSLPTNLIKNLACILYMNQYFN